VQDRSGQLDRVLQEKRGLRMKVRLPLMVVGIIVIVIVVLAWRINSAQRADERFHADLVRSIQLKSDVFINNGEIPTVYSCAGKSYSPPLQWSGIPDGTKSLVLLMTDVDAPSPNANLLNIVHSVLYNMPPDIPGLPENMTTDEYTKFGITTGRNYSSGTNYAPPCPPLGKHRYVFRLYALDTQTIEPKTNNRQGVLKAMAGHVLAYGELIGVYGK